MSQVTGSPLFEIKIRLFSLAKSEAVLAIFSIVRVAESPKQIASCDEDKTGLDIKAFDSNLEVLTHPSASTTSAW